MKKFALHSGYITSINDGDRWKISAQRLVSLYGLLPGEYIIIDFERPETFLGIRNENYIHLYPRSVRGL